MGNSTQTRLHMNTYTNPECLNNLWYPWVLSVEHHIKLRLLLCVLLCVIQLLLPCNNTESVLWCPPTVGLHQQKYTYAFLCSVTRDWWQCARLRMKRAVLMGVLFAQVITSRRCKSVDNERSAPSEL